MRRLGAVLFLILLVAGMNVRSVWSGGGKWGSGTPSGARTDAYWLPDGQTPTGRPFPDVAIGGTLVTDSLMSASWSLGPSDILADLSPNTASLSFKGQVSGTAGDDVVISTGLGNQWAGRLDTLTQTRDTAGDWWTTVTATDRVGALGAAYVVDADGPAQNIEEWAEFLASEAGLTLNVVDDSASGLPVIILNSATITGAVLDLINTNAKRSNVMLALQRDGSLSAVVREAVTPSSVLTLSGVNAPTSWSLAYSIDVDVNRWVITANDVEYGSDPGDIAIYGQRTYVAGSDIWLATTTQFDDWIAYGGSQRPTASASLVVSDFTQDDLILLDPFQWVTESGTNWQVMSVSHNVTASPFSWTVNITLDNLLDLL